MKRVYDKKNISYNYGKCNEKDKRKIIGSVVRVYYFKFR